MSGERGARFSDETIAAVRGATDIVDLIGGFVALRKAGRTWRGLCPFHTEKTPSFHVTPDRGIYHCFGCGKGGDAIRFLMEHEGQTFVDALRFLAERSGITLPAPARGPAGAEGAAESTLRANRIALEWFRRNLADAARGAAAREYLSARGIGPEAVGAFSLGYAPASWDGFLSHAVREGFEPPDLERAGLVVRSERGGRFYDRFRDRVMFPILGPSGQPIAFGGRVLGAEEPKYLNSPETPVFRKGKGLFGLYAHRAAIRDAGEAVLVEGYTDLIGLDGAGIRNVVAPLGTAFTVDQGKLIAGHARRIVLLYDGDSAGRAAAGRALPALLAAGCSVRVALLPDGVDPDEFVRTRGAEATAKVLAAAPSWILHTAAAGASEGREVPARRVVELLALAPDPIYVGVAIAEASLALGLSEELLGAEVAARRGAAAAAPRASAPAPAAPAPRAGEAPTPPMAPGAHRAERGLVALLLRQPLLIGAVGRHLAPDHFEDPSYRRLAEALFAAYREEGVPDAARLLDRFADEERIAGVITESLTAEGEDDPPSRMANDLVVKILRGRLEKERRRLRDDLRRAQGGRDEESMTRLTRDLEENKHADWRLASGAMVSIPTGPE